MVGVGGVLALSFQRRSQSELVPFLIVLGIGCVAAVVGVVLFRTHRRLVDASTLGELADIEPPVPLH